MKDLRRDKAKVEVERSAEEEEVESVDLFRNKMCGGRAVRGNRCGGAWGRKICCQAAALSQRLGYPVWGESVPYPNEPPLPPIAASPARQAQHLCARYITVYHSHTDNFPLPGWATQRRLGRCTNEVTYAEPEECKQTEMLWYGKRGRRGRRRGADRASSTVRRSLTRCRSRYKFTTLVKPSVGVRRRDER